MHGYPPSAQPVGKSRVLSHLIPVLHAWDKDNSGCVHIGSLRGYPKVILYVFGALMIVNILLSNNK